MKIQQGTIVKLANGLNINTKGDFSLGEAFRLANEFYATGLKGNKDASKGSGAFTSTITSFAAVLNKEVERAIAKQLIGSEGGGIIQAGTGGFFPDFFVELPEDSTDVGGVVADKATGIKYQFQEQKLSSTNINLKTGKITRSGDISLAGGSGMVLSAGPSRLASDISIENGKAVISYEQVDTTRFVKNLLEASKNPEKLLNILNGSSKAAQLVKKGIILKANAINIPISMGDTLYNKVLRFSWRTISMAVRNKKMTISVKPHPKIKGAILFQIYFSGRYITALINDTKKIVTKELKSSLGTDMLVKLASKVVAFPGGAVQEDFITVLQKNKLTVALKYLEGSIIISKGSVVPKKRKEVTKKATAQSFISAAQWTALVQARLGETMRHFGEASPPDFTERTGRWRASIEVYANYRTNLLRYTYNPLYDENQAYGYNPSNQVRRAIREVAQMNFNRNFNIFKV